MRQEQIIFLTDLCNNNKDAPIKFGIVNSSGKEINAVQTTIHELEGGKRSFKGKSGASLSFLEFCVEKRPTFLNYQRAGLKISLVAAIDYTSSNGSQSSKSSLHYMDPNSETVYSESVASQGNVYAQALYKVGHVIAPYDSDQSFPVYGFGGEPSFMGRDEADYCFPLNGNKENPSIIGLDNIIATYRKTLPNIKFLGGPRFAPVLEKFRDYVVESSKSQNSYQILVLLTGGCIDDMPQTKELLV